MQISKFLKDVRDEMKNVKWPSKQMATGSTVAVIFISIIVGGYLYAIDLGLKKSYTQVVGAVTGVTIPTDSVASATSTASSTITNASSTSVKATTTSTSTKATTSVIKK